MIQRSSETPINKGALSSFLLVIKVIRAVQNKNLPAIPIKTAALLLIKSQNNSILRLEGYGWSDKRRNVLPLQAVQCL